MIKGECTQCGKTVIASTINDGVCLSCGRPEDSKVTSSRGDIAGVSNSSTTAITTLNGVAVVVLMFSMLSTLRSLYLWLPKKEIINQSELTKNLSQILIKGINK